MNTIKSWNPGILRHSVDLNKTRCNSSKVPRIYDLCLYAGSFTELSNEKKNSFKLIMVI